MNRTLRIFILWLCLSSAIFAQGQADLVAFMDRIQLWQSTDSTTLGEEHRLLTKKLSTGVLSAQDVLEWAESTALLEDRQTWDAHFRTADSLILSGEGTWETQLKHFAVLHAVCQQFPPPNSIVTEPKSAVAWELFKAELGRSIGQIGTAPFDRTQQQIAVTPPAVISWNAAAFALLLCALFAIGIVRELFLNRRLQKARSEDIRNPLLVKIRDKIINGSPDARQIIHIDFVEFKLGLSPIQPLIEKNKHWSRLNHSDLTMLHLIYRGHSMEACAQFTGKTKGHIYNQRSKLRQQLSVPAEVNFSTYVKDMVEGQS